MTIVSRRSRHAAAAFTFLQFILAISVCRGKNTSPHVLCPEIEKQSLLSFKQSVEDPDSMLSSWDGEVDCCRWKGVVCDDFTGHVTQLLLQYDFDAKDSSGLSGKINSSLLNLTHLYLSGSRFLGEVKWFFLLNNLGGPIPVFNNVNATKLGYLHLSWNFCNSSIPDWLYSCTHLEFLDLIYNSLSDSGTISTAIANLTSLKTLSLSWNQLSGEIPRGISHLCKLEGLNLAYSVPSRLWEMEILILSHNNLTGKILHLKPPLQIIYLDSNQLSGELPDCWINWPHLNYLNIGNSNMFGSIPNSISRLESLTSLNLQNNRFSGHIPFSMQNCDGLQKLDLSGNDPTWMWTSLLYLKISQDICHLNYLQILDLSDNRISGVLQGCVSNFTAMSTKINLTWRSSSHFAGPDGIITTRFGFRADSVTIGTKEREFKYDTILPLVTHVDLSKNNLSGEIPTGLMSLVELRSLNLSGNGFTGSIPDRIGELKQLESLDLSRNSLAGQIPDGFKLLYSLDYLNKLTGRIPTTTQLQSLDARSFMGNDLCGPPSTRNCSSDGEDVHPQEEQKQGDQKSKIDWLYVFLSLGFAVGFSGVCTTLGLNKSCIVAYFGFVECTWDKLYVHFYVKWRRLTKPSPPFQSLFFLILLFNPGNSIVFCPEIEKESLLSFKNSSRDPNKLLSTWNGEVNCCNWTGVTCHNSTGHVHQLHLQGSSSFGGLQLGLGVDSLAWLWKLSELESLNFNYVNLSEATNWAQVINSFPSLKQVSLASCSLQSITPLHHANSSSSSLTFIDLSGNYLLSSFAYLRWVLQLPTLVFLILSENNLSGNIPREIANLCKLQYLDLAGNNLQGDIFHLFGDVSDCSLGALQFLSLSGNQFSGAIPISLGKLTSMKTMFLNHNKFTGNLPESLGQLINLEELYIQDNMLEGVVTEIHFANLTKLRNFCGSNNHLTLKVSTNWNPPFQIESLRLRSWSLSSLVSESLSWIQNQKNIWELDLSNTGISFNIPSYFWGIQYLNLSHNNLQGQIPYLQGAIISRIYVSSNRFSGVLPRVGDTVVELDLSNNSFSGGMSHFLCDTAYKTYSLGVLHLRGNQLSGELPDCWMRWPSLRYLNLGDNHLYGSIPPSIGYLGQLESLNLYNNRFSDEIPSSLQNCTYLVKMDLANNEVHGSLPAWIGTSLVHLRVLVLRSNNLSGNISSEICRLNFLQILDLSDNKFTGMIPSCVYNFTVMTAKESVDDYPYWLFDYSTNSGSVIESASVSLKGSLRQYDTTLSLLMSIDLSRNSLSGDIPEEFASLVELRSLNLSDNHLTGLIPGSIGDMKQLESLDLSVNSLSGQIPNGLALLHFLSYLNLSYNRLTGSIPGSTQILSFSDLSFIGNNLCGPPLARNCSHDEVHKHEESEDDDKPEIEWLYVLLSLGFAVGFSGVCTTLVVNKSWRDAYFGTLECIWDKVYVFVSVQWIRLSKPSGTN